MSQNDNHSYRLSTIYGLGAESSGVFVTMVLAVITNQSYLATFPKFFGGKFWNENLADIIGRVAR